MARRAGLGGGTLNPFGGGGVDFGAFNIVDVGQEAYLKLLKVQVQWNAGKASDTEYLAALEVYAKALGTTTSEGINAQARLEETRYRVERNVLVSKVENGEATMGQLVAYDKRKLEGLKPDSDEYRQRLDQYRSSQAQSVAEMEKAVVDQYGNGKMTTTQLQNWYKQLLDGSLIDRNPELEQSIEERVKELDDRVVDERDSHMLSDFNDGKVSTADFLAYATSARARYNAGTEKAREWDDRIQKARESGGETNLLYRYNLSQQYAELQRFVQSNAGKPAGGTSTSTTKRTILGSDGQWHTVTSTSTKATAPSAAQQKAYAQLQVQIQDAKRHMAEIAAKVATVGGFVSTPTVQGYYQKQLSKFAKGSAEWYRVQGKLDDLNDRLHAEAVYSRQGIKITYPRGGGGSGGSGGGAGGPSMAGSSWNPGGSKGGRGGGGISLDQFMRAIASQESGGRYDARNKTTGAYGKYQILPSNWSSWAQKAGLPGNAPMTPENQERVARAAFERLAKSYDGDWSRVAAAWFGGVGGERNRGPRTNAYVRAIMGKLGTTASAVGAGGWSGGGGSYAGGGGGGGGPTASAAQPGRGGTPNKGGPLSVVTGAGAHLRKTSDVSVSTQATGFPRNLDSRQFERFYANFEKAFESGQESFVDTSSGSPIHYYIGDDPDERRDRMRQLDDLKIRLYDERAVAYQGTASELTAANQRNEAYKDVARHEYMILNTESGNPSTFLPKFGNANPLATGIRILDKKEAAIKANLEAAKAAFARGDITAAYSELQMAQHLVVDQSSANIAGWANATEAAIAAIQSATGGIDPSEALGSEKGGQFQTDLDRLRNFDDELASLFADDEKANEVLGDIKKYVKTDAKGNPIWDDTGPNAQLVLQDDAYWELSKSGALALKTSPPTWDPKTGQMTHQKDGTVGVKVKSGNSVIDAQAAYEVGAVGAFVDDAGQRHTINGKVVNYRNEDGTWTTFYENPMAPGSKGGWSNKPFLINAPKGFKVVDEGGGKVSYQFTTGGSGGMSRNQPGGGAGSSGWTYTLRFDDKTGVYMVYGSKAGGLFSSEIVDQFIGIAGDQDIASLFADAGFVRNPQGTGGDPFDSTDQPVFGMDGDQYEDWLDNYQPPSQRLYGAKAQGGKDDVWTGALAAGARGAAVGLFGATGRGGSLGASQQSRFDVGFRDITDAEQDYIRRGLGGAEKRDDVRHGLPPVPQFGGRSLEDRDAAAARAKLPPLPPVRKITPPPVAPPLGGAPGAYRPPPPPKNTSGAKAQGGKDDRYIPPPPRPKPVAPPPRRGLPPLSSTRRRAE